MHGRQSPAGLGDSMRSETSSRSRAFKVFAHVGACEATSTAGKAAVLTTVRLGPASSLENVDVAISCDQAALSSRHGVTVTLVLNF